MKEQRLEEVVTARIEDIESMVSLNDRIYPEEWHVAPQYIKEIMIRNPDVYRIVKTPSGVKGIYGLFPLTQHDYEAVLTGKLEEEEVGYFLLDYNQPKTVYLYLVTVIVDIYDERRKEYARQLIKDIPLELKRLEDKGIDVAEIGAFAVSEDGEKLLPKIGFDHMKETFVLYDQEYPVFRANREKVMEKIKI